MLYQTLVICVLVVWIWMKTKKSSLDPPDLSGKLPLVGHTLKFAGDRRHAFKLMVSVSEEVLKRGGVLTIYFGLRKNYVVSDPDDCLLLCNKCLDKDHYYDIVKSLLGNGLSIAEVPIWKHHRKHLNKLFGQRTLNTFLGVFNCQAKSLVESFRKELGQESFDHAKRVFENNLEYICKTIFGVYNDFDGLHKIYQSGIHEMMKIFVKRSQNFWLHSDFIYNFTYLKKQEDSTLNDIKEFTHKVVNILKINKDEIENKQDFDKPDQYKPLIELLFDISQKTGAYSDEDFLNEINTMFFEAYDTISSAMVLILIILGSYPEVQNKAYDEIDSIFQGSKRGVDKDDLSKLLYLKAVLKEILRLYPVGPIISRHLTQDVRLKNYNLKTGSSICILNWALHRHPAWGLDVNIFKPERWLDPSTLPENPNLFTGFSLGRRDCIGKTYAMMSMQTTLVHVLRSYVIKSDITKLELEVDFLLRPVSGHHISLEERPVYNSEA